MRLRDRDAPSQEDEKSWGLMEGVAGPQDIRRQNRRHHMLDRPGVRYGPVGTDEWADFQDSGNWNKGGDVRDYSSDPLVLRVYGAAELMAFLKQSQKGPDFYVLGNRLTHCLELLDIPSDPLVLDDNLDLVNLELEEPAQKMFDKMLKRPAEKPLPAAFSLEWTDAVENQYTEQKRRERYLVAYPKDPISGEYIYKTPTRKPKVGRPKKHAAPKNRNADLRRRQRRRDELETTISQSSDTRERELHRIVQEDSALLRMIGRHLEELEDAGGYNLNVAVIKSACGALVAGRLEIANLISDKSQTETLTSATS